MLALPPDIADNLLGFFPGGFSSMQTSWEKKIPRHCVLRRCCLSCKDLRESLYYSDAELLVDGFDNQREGIEHGRAKKLESSEIPEIQSQFSQNRSLSSDKFGKEVGLFLACKQPRVPLNTPEYLHVPLIETTNKGSKTLSTPPTRLQRLFPPCVPLEYHFLLPKIPNITPSMLSPIVSNPSDTDLQSVFAMYQDLPLSSLFQATTNPQSILRHLSPSTISVGDVRECSSKGRIKGEEREEDLLSMLTPRVTSDPQSTPPCPPFEHMVCRLCTK